MDRPGFFFCICPDAALIREYVEGEFIAPSKGDPPDVHVFWADEGLDCRFWDNLTLIGMDGRFRVLVVRGAEYLPAEIWKRLSVTLGTPRSGVLPVFCLEGAWEKGQPKLPAHIAKLKCLAFAEKKQWVWRSAGIEARTLGRYLQKRASAKGLRMTLDAVNVLSEMLVPDAFAVHNALEQLFLASSDSNVDVDLVRQMTKFTPDAVIFDIVRQLEASNAQSIWKAFLQAGDSGESLLFPLLTLMAREARILWQINVGEKVFVPQYVEKEKRCLASRIGLEGLSHIFSALRKAEFSVKSGVRQPLQAMEELVADLSLTFSVSREEAPRVR